MSGGQEGKLVEDDLDLERNWAVVASVGHFATMKTLTFDKLAEQNPERAFIHTYPGFVNTGVLGRHTTGFLGFVVGWLEWIGGFFNVQPEEAGERMLYIGTCPEFAKGSWALWEGKPQDGKKLREYREKGTADTVVEHNQKIFERVTSA